jgi:hypothetical protein
MIILLESMQLGVLVHRFGLSYLCFFSFRGSSV